MTKTLKISPGQLAQLSQGLVRFLSVSEICKSHRHVLVHLGDKYREARSTGLCRLVCTKYVLCKAQQQPSQEGHKL